MTYKINGTALTVPPTTGKWLPRQEVGVDGNGRPIYGPLREFEMRWDIVGPAVFGALQTYFDSIGATGTIVVEIPKYGAATYQFWEYSGCYISEPEAAEYFESNQMDVVLLVRNIRIT